MITEEKREKTLSLFLLELFLSLKIIENGGTNQPVIEQNSNKLTPHLHHITLTHTHIANSTTQPTQLYQLYSTLLKSIQSIAKQY